MIGWGLADFLSGASILSAVHAFPGFVKDVALDFELDTHGIVAEAQSPDIQPNLWRVAMSAKFQDYEDSDHTICMSVQRSSKRGRRPRFDGSAFDETARPFQFVVQEIDVETKNRILEPKPDGRILGCIPNHFFPDSLVVRCDRNKSMARSAALHITQRIRSTPRRAGVIYTLAIPRSTLDMLQTSVRRNASTDTRADEIVKHLFVGMDDENLTVGDWVYRLSGPNLVLRRQILPALAELTDQIQDMIYKQLLRSRNLRDELIKGTSI